MSAALAVHRPDHSASHSSAEPERLHSTPRSFFQPIAPSRDPTQTQQPQMASTSSPPRPDATMTDASPRNSSNSPANHSSKAVDEAPSAGPSPSDSRSASSRLPPPQLSRIEIKTERPPSPSPVPPMTGRRRPQKLDLDTNASLPAGRPSAPLTAEKSGGLSAMHEVATACLSPGFDTTDPKMRSQMERSRDLAEQQRQLIAARQNRGIREREVSSSKGPSDLGPPPSSFSKPLGTSRRKAPPSMLSLNAAATGQYSEPRVIQSAPINQTFTGLHRPVHPLSRQVLEHSHQHSRTQPALQHMQYTRPAEGRNEPPSPYAAAPQSANRLPPIADLVRSDGPMQSSHGPSPSEFRPTHTLHRANSGPNERTNGSGESLYAPHVQPSASSPVNSAYPSEIRYSQQTPIQQRMDGPGFAPLHQGSNSSPLGSANPSNSQHAYYKPVQRSGSSSEEERRIAEGRRREDHNGEHGQHGSNGYHTKPGAPQTSAYPSNYYPTPNSSTAAPPRRLETDGRTGEEVVQSIEGRDELHPRLVHYGGRQPPTPNSPLPPIHSAMKTDAGQLGAPGRRRTRDEYERDHDAPDADERERERERRRQAEAGLGFGFGAWSNSGSTRHTPETMRRKKEEFMSICARAWDLLHE